MVKISPLAALAALLLLLLLLLTITIRRRVNVAHLYLPRRRRWPGSEASLSSWRIGFPLESTFFVVQSERPTTGGVAVD